MKSLKMCFFTTSEFFITFEFFITSEMLVRVLCSPVVLVEHSLLMISWKLRRSMFRRRRWRSSHLPAVKVEIVEILGEINGILGEINEILGGINGI